MISTAATATQDQNYYSPSTYYTESDSINDTTPSILRAGYEAQISLVLRNLQSNNTPAYEILNDNSGGLDIAVMRPLSRGATHIIDGRDVSVAPTVDPRWLSHPFDFEVMILAMQFNQRILDTPSISALMPEYSYNDDNDNIPGTSTGSSSACLAANATRQQLETVLRRGINTEYHYSGTCAMMPMSLGGVVDSALRVYGIQGLRVVDTSVYPVVPGAHLQAVAYAVAERAADIIRGRSLAGTSEG
jgi:choline dehydrogenase-like flavoprotein